MAEWPQFRRGQCHHRGTLFRRGQPVESYADYDGAVDDKRRGSVHLMWNWITRWGSFGRERATATADLAITDRRVKTAGGRYVALHKYLENRYADVIVLTFGQIEDLLGFALPQLARTYHAWWTLGQTNVGGPPHSDAWTLAGRTATPNLQAQTVLFERISTVKAGLQ